MFHANTIAARGLHALNLKQYSYLNTLEKVGRIELNCPFSKQYILRMLIKQPFGDFQFPTGCAWLKSFVEKCYQYQKNVVKIKHPFCYLTVRHGVVESINDDEWHVDGFSLNINHLPEQNYCWSNVYPTEYVQRTFEIPADFDPSIYNIHLYFQDRIDGFEFIKRMRNNMIYCFDPYIVHRRPKIPNNVVRTFIRLSFCPIEIRDDNNTPNPLIELPKYNRDGIKDFRQNLIKYKY